MRMVTYMLLLQITARTSCHSSDNTQYYANKCLCDSGAAVGVAFTALLTADQFAYIPYASLSAAAPPPSNIWLPQCRFVSPTLFHCLNSVLICYPLRSFPFKIHLILLSISVCLIYITSKLVQTWNMEPRHSLISYLFSSVTFWPIGVASPGATFWCSQTCN